MINDQINRRNQSMVWKIQISIRVNFISSLDTHYLYRSVNKKIMLGSQTHDIILELIDSVK